MISSCYHYRLHNQFQRPKAKKGCGNLLARHSTQLYRWDCAKDGSSETSLAEDDQLTDLLASFVV